jgi:hypothetical protein
VSVMLVAVLVLVEAAAPLPHSSIAAVLAQRDQLKLTPAQVQDLDRRDEALQREQAEIRDHFGDPSRTPAGKPSPTYEGPAYDGRARSGLPDTVPGDTESGRRGSQQVQGTPVPGAAPESPRARAARLQSELDAADARAWLEAAARLPPELQEKATAVAEKYREDLVEQRER